LLSLQLPDFKEAEAFAYLLVLVLAAKVFWNNIVSTYRIAVFWLTIASKRTLNSVETPPLGWAR